MRKLTYIIPAILLIVLSSCAPIGNKTTSMSIIYFSTAVLSLLLLVGYFILIRKKTVWFMFLFSSVFVVNMGYYLLSVCKTLEHALFANRLAYLGSVFLPMAMLMIALNVTHTTYKKWLPYALTAISGVVFLITASYPYFNIYYKDVTLKMVNGVAVLCKTYGSWHGLYLVFLLTYFIAMIAVVAHALKQNKLKSRAQSVVLAIAMFVNIFVWLLEQLVEIDFEFLSVSYIMTELFLIGLFLVVEEEVPLAAASASEVKEIPAEETVQIKVQETPEEEARLEFFKENLHKLTPTENKIYNLYLEGKTTKEIMELLNIKENTLKYHNKNLYGKLGVSSRKELIHISKML